MNTRKQHRRDRDELAVLGLIIAVCCLLGALLLPPRHAKPADSGVGPGPAAGRAAPSGHATAPLPSPVPAQGQAGTGPHTLPDTTLDVAGSPVAGAVVTAETETEFGQGMRMDVAGPEAGASRPPGSAGGCAVTGAPGAAPSIQVHVPGDLEPGALPAVDDLVGELSLLADQPAGRAALPAPPCVPGEVHIAVLGHGRDEQGQRVAPDLEPQAYAIAETRCACDGRRVVLRGGSLLSGQWAVYDLLTRLGIRYLHPEQTLYPERLVWPAEPMDVVARPAFRNRALHVRGAHPVELSPPHDASALGIDMAAYQRRWIDWNVKMRQTFVSGWIARSVGTYAYERGFPRHTGINVQFSQKSGQPILDPDAPQRERKQLMDDIHAPMAPRDGMPAPSRFRLGLNPSVFTGVDKQRAVDRLTWITNYLSESYPEVDIYTVNHGIWRELGNASGVNFFDLLPPALGVQVRQFLFYDLERPAAGVYKNPHYHRNLRAWLVKQQALRRIEHAPKASQWPTFDLPVPLYLAPVVLEARQHDIDLLAPFLATGDAATTGVHGHRLLSSGQEWGYWLIDYCVAQMTWSLDMTYEACLRDFTSQLAGGDELLAVLEAVTARQVNDLRDPELVRFLVGSDDTTELGALAGMVVHPLPPRPGAVLTEWGDAAAAALEPRSLAPLRAMAGDYHTWATRVEAVQSLQSPAQAPWVREIRDGLRVFALRAAHAVAVYETALALRKALAAGDLDAVRDARAGLDRARAITEQARAVVYGREIDYRYPDQLTIAGDELFTEGAIENGTAYPFRVLSRTHRMYYWERPDDQLARLFGEGVEVAEGVNVSARIVEQDTPLEVSWNQAKLAEVGLPASDPLALELNWGDNTRASALEPHLYANQRFYRWSLKAAWPTGVVQHQDEALVVARRMVFAKGSLVVEEVEGVEEAKMPMVAGIVESSLPGFVVGLGNDGADFLALGRIDGDAPVATRGAIWRRDRVDLSSGPEDFELTLDDIGAITVSGAAFTIEEGESLDAPRLTIEGELATEDIIDLLASRGEGSDKEIVTELVAMALNSTPDTLPEHIAFRVVAQGFEE